MLAQVERGVDDEGRARRQPVDPLHQARLAAVEAILEELHQRTRVQVARARPHGEERLQLGGEEEPVRQPRVVEGLDAEAVAGEHQLAPARVVQREGEHAVQRREGVETIQRVGVQDGLAVGGRGEAPAARLERRAQLDEVVDLAVGGEGEVAVDHRLVPALEIDDRQPRLGEPEGPGHVHAQVVGAAVGERGGHAPQRALVGAAVPQQDTGNATHGQASSG